MGNEKTVEQNPSRNNPNFSQGLSDDKKIDSQSDTAKRMDSQQGHTDGGQQVGS